MSSALEGPGSAVPGSLDRSQARAFDDQRAALRHSETRGRGREQPLTRRRTCGRHCQGERGQERGRQRRELADPEQARELLLTPDTSTLKGRRDRAILAVFLGCGLRRSELVALEMHQVAQRENRWVIVAFRGKGGRKRTVLVPAG